jgi:hypothetical protein
MKRLRHLTNSPETFFWPLDKIDKSFGEVADPNHRTVFGFNGHDIERWMLKPLCGFVYSKNSESQSGRIENREPSYQWLEFLFGHNELSAGLGLHIYERIYHANIIHRMFACAPVSNEPSVFTEGRNQTTHAVHHGHVPENGRVAKRGYEQTHDDGAKRETRRYSSMKSPRVYT